MSVLGRKGSKGILSLLLRQGHALLVEVVVFTIDFPCLIWCVCGALVDRCLFDNKQGRGRNERRHKTTTTTALFSSPQQQRRSTRSSSKRRRASIWSPGAPLVPVLPAFRTCSTSTTTAMLCQKPLATTKDLMCYRRRREIKAAAATISQQQEQRW